DLGKIKLPSFPVPNGKTPGDYLKELCHQGLEKKYQKAAEDQRKKTASINRALFLILIFIILVFVYSLWRYQALN
ncbi:MAG: hypothetical protein CVV29_09915, partial [Methanobacteriales archaeon HGW-Methanobacteriales-2]